MTRLLLALAALLPLLVAPAAAESGTPGAGIRIATEGAYKPWNFRAEDGTLAGFDVDLARLLCADLALDCTIVAAPWSTMLARLDAGAFDAIFAGMSITETRKVQATFSLPYAATPAVFVSTRRLPGIPKTDLVLPGLDGREQATLVALRKALLNGVVGVQKATTHEVFLRDYLEGYVQVRTYESQGALDADVANGTLTAMLVSLGYAAPLERPTGAAGMRIIGPRLSGGPFGEGIGAAFRKADTQLAAAFSDAIARHIADGTIRKLSLRWFGFDISAQP
tara:strand:- start:391 stop:1230 length:840 start_codon:yes stop_codon:yes gene_type:complete